MEIKNGERKNQDKSKVMLVFDYDGTIQETIKIYAPAIFDIAKRLKNMLLQNKLTFLKWRLIMMNICVWIKYPLCGVGAVAMA